MDLQTAIKVLLATGALALAIVSVSDLRTLRKNPPNGRRYPWWKRLTMWGYAKLLIVVITAALGAYDQFLSDQAAELARQKSEEQAQADRNTIVQLQASAAGAEFAAQLALFELQTEGWSGYVDFTLIDGHENVAYDGTLAGIFPSLGKQGYLGRLEINLPRQSVTVEYQGVKEGVVQVFANKCQQFMDNEIYHGDDSSPGEKYNISSGPECVEIMSHYKEITEGNYTVRLRAEGDVSLQQLIGETKSQNYFGSMILSELFTNDDKSKIEEIIRGIVVEALLFVRLKGQAKEGEGCYGRIGVPLRFDFSAAETRGTFADLVAAGPLWVRACVRDTWYWGEDLPEKPDNVAIPQARDLIVIDGDQ
jgi:hypothetical protein